MPDPQTRLRKLRNIGPASEERLNEAGFHTLAELEEAGAVEAYRRVRALRPGATLNLLWALQGALLNLKWTDLPEDMKTDLLAQLEAPD